MEEETKFPTNLEDIEKLAHKLMIEKGHPERADGWTHRKGGVETGATWRRAKEIYESVGLRQRAINALDIDTIDLSASIAGEEIALPISIAPMVSGINFVCDSPFFEIAKAAAKLKVAAGIGYPSGKTVYSGMASLGAKTFRVIKPAKEREKLISELRESYEGGLFAAGVDIDSIGGMKPVGDELRFPELARPYGKDELKRVRDAAPGKFILKGVMSEEDALDALEIGADAIIVSTHVGYSLDYSLSPLEVLPGIRRAVGDKMSIVLDSGITRGTDVLKAVALGADSVLIGRLVLWGLLIDGASGVEHMIGRLTDELKRAMVLMGVGSLKELSPKNLAALDSRGERLLQNA